MFKNLFIKDKPISFNQDDFRFKPYDIEGYQNGWQAKVKIGKYTTKIRYGGNSNGFDTYCMGYQYEVKFPDEQGTLICNADQIWERINHYILLKKNEYIKLDLAQHN